MRTLLSVALALAVVGCHEGLGDPPAPDGTREARLVRATSTESCPDEPLFVPAPPELLETVGIDCDASHTWCFRLHRDLRAAAAARDPLAALARSAEFFELHAQTGEDRHATWARAYADLAVSGAASYRELARLTPRASDVPTDAGRASVEAALDRAYAVAWALRGPAAHRASAREELGWIAVSPEDDLPDRPVNVLASPFRESDVVLDVPLADGTSQSVRTRVVVASTLAPQEPATPPELVGSLPEPAPLAIPSEGDIIVVVHGHSSRAEEAVPLMTALLDEYEDRGLDATLVAMDLPSNGYADRLDPAHVLAHQATRDGLLRFYDAFLVAFVGALDETQPGASDRIVAFAGGSLGGNLVLRVGETSDGRAWPGRLVVWSPASIDYSWLRAKLPFAAGDGEFVDIVKHEAVRLTRDASEEAESSSSREDFFTAGLSSVAKQSEYWYRDDLPCRDALIGAGLTQLGEIYDARMRRWHYRVAYEQLVFSHIEVDETGALRFERLSRPLLLATGDADDSVPMTTWTFVERLAPFLPVPGPTLYFETTGHTVHTERPRALGAETAAFLLDGTPEP
jgi:hypothetical protein